MTRIALGSLVVLLSACTYTFRYERDDIQRKLVQRFPVEVRRGPLVTRLRDPDISLHPTANRLRLRLGIDAVGPALGASGVVEVEGRPEYVPSEGAFYLREPVLQTLRLERASTLLTEGLRELGRQVGVESVPAWTEESLRELAVYSVEQALRDHAVYQLDPDKRPSESRVRNHLREVRIEDGKLVLEAR